MKLIGRLLFALVAICILIPGAGCSQRDPAELDIARAPVDPLVFDDDFGSDAYPQAFSGTYTEAASLDTDFVFEGSASLKLEIPGEGSALGAYAGGVITSVGARDFTDFNALTFYARSNVNTTLNLAGFGNDNTGASRYDAARANIPLTPDWTFVVVPIPLASRLIAERGLFTFAEGWEEDHPGGHQVWVDEIRFAKLGNISNPRPFIPSAFTDQFVGQTTSLQGSFTVFNVDGANLRVDHFPGYFDFDISDPAVARVKAGQIEIIGTGSTVITAALDTIPAVGAVSLTGHLPPTAPAPVPTVPAEKVISFYSDAYNDRAVDSFNPFWSGSTTQIDDYVIDGDNTIMYSSLNYVGIIFTSQKLNASDMTHLHLDVFAPAGTKFKVKIVAFGSADDESSDHEPELEFGAETTPAFVPGQWSSLDIPLADFQLNVPWDYIGMIILSGEARLALVDNLYWYRAEPLGILRGD